jgi:ABC-2 type transport system permease protein
MKPLYWQIRREFWEHRALWMAPPAIAIVLLLATAIFGHIRLDFGDSVSPGDGPAPSQVFEFMQVGWSVPFYLAALILASAYLLDCLYGERRDRSILFWRSLPVSDERTVLVKLLVGLVIVPLATFLVIAVTSLAASAILVLRNHGLVLNGMNVPLWNTRSWLGMQGLMLYGVIAAILWYAPFAAYLMLVSVWARRSPYAWALIPPLLLVILEHMVFGTNYSGQIVDGGFGELLHRAYRLNDQNAVTVTLGNAMPAPDIRGGDQVRLTTQLLSPLHLLASARLWCGLLAAGLMTVLTIRLRSARDDS